ncbi:McrB family protein [Mucilaginibacter lutimaris]|uniref:McrB family protein n=1 Tax=Mucilaginibacter lutimaris TaxID=931629 RepID=A0ABW2ZKH8_9SPHI
MDTKYYCVGFYWYGSDPENQLPRFIEKGIWENGFDDKYLDKVNSIPVGSKLAAKTSYTRKENGKTVSVLEIHCIGTVTANPKNGHTLNVSWDKDFKKFKLDGRGAYRSTISQVNHRENIDYIFGNKKQKEGSALPAFNKEALYEEKQLNQILYGPPGSGKTYHTINKAVSIIDRIKESDLGNYFPNRKSLKERFDELLIDDWSNPQGQIAFITFHQSFNYEEFIEGIKPSLNNKDIQYEYASGIFKSIVDLATDNWLNVHEGNKAEVSFDEAFFKFKERWEENQEMPFKMKTPGKEFTIIGFTNSSILFKKASGGTDHTLSIKTLRDFYYGRSKRKLSGIGIYYPGVLEELKKDSEVTIEEDKDDKNYVLIIDEINRGNVSQIFGELITLIEQDKRIGNKEALEVILPYSKEKFSVPPNLYIIGTMNTADRSVEALDTALRRRFSFTEMPPKPNLLSPERLIWQLWKDYGDVPWVDPEFLTKEQQYYSLFGAKDLSAMSPDEKDNLWEKIDKNGEDESIFNGLTFDGLKLKELLRTINRRLEILLTSDHLIGHSYFMSIYSMDDLSDVIYDKVLPLLQEYFYGDFGKIGLVLGKGFIKREQTAEDINDVLADFDDYDMDAVVSKDIFKIIDYRSRPVHQIVLNELRYEVDFPQAINLLINSKIEPAA